MAENQPQATSDDGAEPTGPQATQHGQPACNGKAPRGKRRLRRRLLYLMGMLVAVIALAELNNNVAWWPTSRGTFAADFDQGHYRAYSWVIGRRHSPEELNPALLNMLNDVAELSASAPLRNLVRQFSEGLASSPWRRLVDPAAEVRSPTRSELAALDDYQRWTLYALAPAQCALSDQDRADMIAPDMHRRGSLTHQLFAVLLYRKRVGPSAELDGLVDRLSERIAAEAVWDFRVTDLYLQRVAFLLAAGRPDLVRRRWVERVIANQEADGGWVSSWYGLGPRTLEFSFRGKASNAHTTVQGLWICAMLKFRYPHWVDQNYSP
jgi:hypothetical protein